MGFAGYLNSLLLRLRLAEVACFAPVRLSFSHGDQSGPVRCVETSDRTIEIHIWFKRDPEDAEFALCLDGQPVKWYAIDETIPVWGSVRAIIEVGLPEVAVIP